MHEGHHGIFDDMEDMDNLFGIGEEHDHEHCHHHNHDEHDEHHHHNHDDSKKQTKKKFGLFKNKKSNK